MTERRSAALTASVSIKEVATAAGVSVGTVSNVLNKPHLVAETTRDRVQAAIAELGFVRNESARHLRSGASRAVGLVVIDAANPFFSDVARGVEDTVQAAGGVVLLGNSAGDSDREHRYLELFEQQRVRGVLIAPTGDAVPPLDSLARRGIPVVFLDRYPEGADCSSVSVDDVARWLPGGPPPARARPPGGRVRRWAVHAAAGARPAPGCRGDRSRPRRAPRCSRSRPRR